MRRFITYFLGTFLILFLASTAYAKENGTTHKITILTKKEQVEIVVEIAKTPEAINRGLMFRNKLADKTGMLFLFSAEAEVEFWMKNTFISLDMLFIDKKGIITKIAKKTTPLSTKHIPSGGKVLAVLELSGGSADKLHIATGDRVLYPHFHE